VIGDFSGIRKWAVLVQSESVEDTPAGRPDDLDFDGGLGVGEAIGIDATGGADVLHVGQSEEVRELQASLPAR